MSNFIISASLTALLLASTSAKCQEVLVIGAFDELPQEQQVQIISASYRAALVTLAFDNTSPPGPRSKNSQFGSCLVDRDEPWAVQAYLEYKATRTLQPQESVGAVIAKALAWKCGIFPAK